MDTGEVIVAASEFKAKCLDLLDQVAARKITRLIVTKRGKAMAVVTPPVQSKDAERLFGAMRGSVIVPEGVDLTAPVFEGMPKTAEGIVYE